MEYLPVLRLLTETVCHLLRYFMYTRIVPGAVGKENIRALEMVW